MAEQKREMDEVDDEDDPVIMERWHGVVDAIVTTTRDAFPASPRFDTSSSSAFQTYWRTVFSRLRQDVAANPDISQHLTSPPVRKFSIHLFDKIHGLCCPCGHPDVEPKITLQNKDGVTKEELMDGFINYMYGEKLPAVYIEPDPLRSGDEEDHGFVPYDFDHADEVEGPALVYRSDWMSSAFKSDEEKEAYSSEPNIVFYCCPPEEFAGKVKDDDEAGPARRTEGDEGSRAKL